MLRALLCSLTLTLLAGNLAYAASPELSPEQLREASAILGDTWSPFCPGRTLTSCTSGKAAEWREDVRRWLAEGLTRDEIYARLQKRVPGFTLNTVPETGGTRYGPWVMGGLFLIALAGLGLFHARKSPPKAGGETSAPPKHEHANLDRRALSLELEALED